MKNIVSLQDDLETQALLRIAVVCNVPIACNRASADFMFCPFLMSREYTRTLPSYEEYMRRRIAASDSPEPQGVSEQSPFAQTRVPSLPV
jgi:hypothetical protein